MKAIVSNLRKDNVEYLAHAYMVFLLLVGIPRCSPLGPDLRFISCNNK